MTASDRRFYWLAASNRAPVLKGRPLESDEGVRLHPAVSIVRRARYCKTWIEALDDGASRSALLSVAAVVMDLFLQIRQIAAKCHRVLRHPKLSILRRAWR
jgi:hypothetical protein